MIIGVDKKELQNQRNQKYNEYAILLNSSNPSKDKLNEVKSELKYLDDKLKKINGRNEEERTKQVKNKKLGLEQMKIDRYNDLKAKMVPISPMKRAVNRIINDIVSYQNYEEKERTMVKM